MGEEIGISVFFGVEMSDWGTDFLIYGLPPRWYFDHPEIMGMDRVEQLKFLAAEGALIIQAHPFREHPSTDRISLFPRFVHGAEIYNANQNEFRNKMAEIFAESFKLIPFALNVLRKLQLTAGANKIVLGICASEILGARNIVIQKS